MNWGLLDRELKDRGGCIALFTLKNRLDLTLSNGNHISLRDGHWALVSGASISLGKVLSRLNAGGRKDPWGWDRIRIETSVKPIPFRSSTDIGEKLRTAISAIASEEIRFEELKPGENVATLFWFDRNPMGITQFIDAIIRLRIDEPSLTI